MRAASYGGRLALGALLANTIIVQALTFVLRPTATYRAVELEVPTAWLGALAASFAVVPLILALPSGHAVDRFGERRVMLTGSVLLVCSGATFLLAGTTVVGLVVATAVLGTGHLCSVVGQQALVANSSPSDGYDSAFGFYTFAASLGQAVGPSLIVVFGGRQPIPQTTAIFVAASTLSAVLLVVTLFIRPVHRHASRGAQQETGGLRQLARQPGLLRALLVSCLVLAAVDITLVYLPALGAERGIAAGAIGALLTVRAAASMVSRLFLGRLASRLGRHRLLTGSVAVSALSLAAIIIPMPFAVLAAVTVILGLGLGVGQPMTMSWLASTAPPGLRGRAMSLRLSGNRMGQVVVPSAAGLLAAGAGAAGVLGLMAAALAGAGFVAHTLNRPPEPSA